MIKGNAGLSTRRFSFHIKAFASHVGHHLSVDARFELFACFASCLMRPSPVWLNDFGLHVRERQNLFRLRGIGNYWDACLKPANIVIELYDDHIANASMLNGEVAATHLRMDRSRGDADCLRKLRHADKVAFHSKPGCDSSFDIALIFTSFANFHLPPDESFLVKKAAGKSGRHELSLELKCTDTASFVA